MGTGMPPAPRNGAAGRGVAWPKAARHVTVPTLAVPFARRTGGGFGARWGAAAAKRKDGWTDRRRVALERARTVEECYRRQGLTVDGQVDAGGGDGGVPHGHGVGAGVVQAQAADVHGAVGGTRLPLGVRRPVLLPQVRLLEVGENLEFQAGGGCPVPGAGHDSAGQQLQRKGDVAPEPGSLGVLADGEAGGLAPCRRRAGEQEGG